MTTPSLELRSMRGSLWLIATYGYRALAADWGLILGAAVAAAGTWVLLLEQPWGLWLVPLTATLFLGVCAALMRWTRREPLPLHWGRWLGLALLLSACQWPLVILSFLDERFAGTLVLVVVGGILMQGASQEVPFWLLRSLEPAMYFGFVLAMAFAPGLAALGHASPLRAVWWNLCIWAGHPSAALVAFVGLAATIGWWSFPWWTVVGHHGAATVVQWGGLVFGTGLLVAWAMAVQCDAIEYAAVPPPDFD